MSTEERPEQNPGSPGTYWVDSYTACYQYGYTRLMMVLPVLGLLGILVAIPSTLAVAAAIAAEVLFILVFLEWKTYRVRIGEGSIARSSCLHRKSFPLSEVDLIQHVYGGRDAQFLYIRHGSEILLKVYRQLVGFDDLLEFLREYARHHHLIFATRDSFGTWTQAGNSPPDENR